MGDGRHLHERSAWHCATPLCAAQEVEVHALGGLRDRVQVQLAMAALGCRWILRPRWCVPQALAGSVRRGRRIERIAAAKHNRCIIPIKPDHQRQTL
jgi:hypothetical protein